MGNLPFEYHYAFNGTKKLSDKEISKYTVSPESIAHSKGQRQPMNKKQYGCIHSHIDVAKKARDTNLNEYLVLEEDSIISPDFSYRIKIIENETPEDVDMIFLGCGYYGPKSSIGSGKHGSRLLPIEEKYRITDHLWNFHVPKHYGTYGMLIKKSGYNKLISIWERYDDLADLSIYKARRKFEINVLNLVPACVYKKDGFSFIENKVRDYRPTRRLYSMLPDLEDAPGIRKSAKGYEVHDSGQWPKSLF